MSKSPSQLPPHRILEIIEECSSELGVLLPDDFRGDFETHFTEAMTSSDLLRNYFCRKIDELLRDRILEKKYGAIYTAMLKPVRARIWMELGLETFNTNDTNTEKCGSGDDHNLCFELLKFLNKLPVGEEWSITTLIHFDGIDGSTKGSTLYQWIRIRFCKRKGYKGVTEEAIKGLLGDEADEVLKRNPFKRGYSKKKVERGVNSAIKTREYLLSFMVSLPEGGKWSMSDLHDCQKVTLANAQDEVKGVIVYQRIHRLRKKRDHTEITEELIRDLLGDRADEALRRNPFVKRSHEEKEEEKERRADFICEAQKYLVIFLRNFPQGEAWSMSTLMNYGAISDPSHATSITGIALYGKIRKEYCINGGYKSITEKIVRQILGRKAKTILSRNPFKGKMKKIKT